MRTFYEYLMISKILMDVRIYWIVSLRNLITLSVLFRKIFVMKLAITIDDYVSTKFKEEDLWLLSSLIVKGPWQHFDLLKQKDVLGTHTISFTEYSSLSQ